MKKLIFMLVIFITTPAFAGAAFLKSEYPSATTKLCIYEYQFNMYTLTIPNTQICPLWVEIENRKIKK